MAHNYNCLLGCHIVILYYGALLHISEEFHMAKTHKSQVAATPAPARTINQRVHQAEQDLKRLGEVINQMNANMEAAAKAFEAFAKQSNRRLAEIEKELKA